MSRVNPNNISALLASAGQWRSRCVAQTGSVFTNRSLWASPHFDELQQHFVENLDFSKQSFYEKLANQLTPTSPAAKQLAAEIIWALLLFPSNLTAKTKRKNVQEVWSWSGESLPADHPALSDEVLKGVGSGGLPFKNLIWEQLRYAIQVLRAFKQLPAVEQGALLADGMRFAEWADGLPAVDMAPARHTLLYLLFPDDFERISSFKHKEMLAKDYGKVLGLSLKTDTQVSIDRALKQIREHVEQQNPSANVDFYLSPWHERWGGRAGDTENTDDLVSDAFGGPQTPALPLNQILYGPPGTGKTFTTKQLAVEICNGTAPDDRDEVLKRFEELRAVNRIEFVTFHQSFAYEDFVEGLRPVLDVTSEGGKAASVQYECRPGVFRRICSAARGATETTGQQTPGIDLADRRVFKMSLGDTQLPSEAYIYNECIEKGYVLLGYGEGLDFTGCQNRSDVMQRLKQVKPDIASNDYSISSVAYLMFEVKKGDLILVSDGNTQFRAIGEVIGDYEWVEREDTFSQKRAVRWLRVFDESQPIDLIFGKRLSQMTLYLLDQQSIKREALQALLTPKAQASTPPNHVLIIDEVNRANISKVFGELITLLEPDKRLGASEEIRVRLPYSHQEFGVPGNLHVIGTMNSADHSIALLDTALRRRFVFKELRPEPSLLEGADDHGMIHDEDGDEIDLRQLLQALNQRIEFLRGRDQQIGHAYLMGVKDLAGLQDVFRNQIIPLLQEHFYEDWAGMARVLAVPPKVSPFVIANKTLASDLFGQIDDDYGQLRDEATLYSLAPELTGEMFRGLYAHLKTST